MSKTMMRFAATAIMLVSSSSALANRYVLTDLGARQDPVSINKSGDVASNFRDWRGDVYHNGKWGKKFDFHTQLFSINAHSDVVGANSKYNFPMLWEFKASPIQLPVPPGGTIGEAYSINDSETVVGYYKLNSNYQCFTWTPAQGSIDLAPGQFYFCSATGISNSGFITGTTQASQDDPQAAFVYENGVFQIIGNLPGTSRSEGIAVNNSGQIVGASFDAKQMPRGFTWNGSSLIDWDPAHSYVEVVPAALNDSGEGVGWAGPDDQHASAVRFSKNKLMELQKEVVNGQGWKLFYASSINSKGEIVGSATLNGILHGFLLTPQ